MEITTEEEGAVHVPATQVPWELRLPLVEQPQGKPLMMLDVDIAPVQVEVEYTLTTPQVEFVQEMARKRLGLEPGTGMQPSCCALREVGVPAQLAAPKDATSM